MMTFICYTCLSAVVRFSRLNFFHMEYFFSLLDLSVFYRIEIANVHFIVKSHSYFIPPLWSMRTKLQPSHCWISIGYIDTTLCTIHQIRERKKAQLVIIPKDNCIYFRLRIFKLKQKMHLNRVICEVSGLHDNGHLIVVDTASLGAKIIESVGHWKWFSLNYFPFQFCEFFRLIWVFVFENPSRFYS